MEKITELYETAEMMNNESYNERFKAEYLQLKIRMRKLNEFLVKYKNNELNFTPNCSYDLLKGQFKAMDLYASYLEERALIENVNI